MVSVGAGPSDCQANSLDLILLNLLMQAASSV